MHPMNKGMWIKVLRLNRDLDWWFFTFHRSTAKSRAFKAATFGLTWTFQRFWDQFSIFWKKTSFFESKCQGMMIWWPDEQPKNEKVSLHLKFYETKFRDYQDQLTDLPCLSKLGFFCSQPIFLQPYESFHGTWWGTWLQIFDVEMVIKKSCLQNDSNCSMKWRYLKTGHLLMV